MSYVRSLAQIVLETVIVCAIIILIPYLISGVWTPYHTVISGSMEPNLYRGDIVYVVEPERYAESDSINGIQTQVDSETDGDTIIYRPNGSTSQTPIIHRAIAYVESGENWMKKYSNRSNKSLTCADAEFCPAPNSGYLTLGDNNDVFDQTGGISPPIKQEWIIGKSEQRIPYLGLPRVGF